ncbi:MarR family winged helix-turn-helix transcriptional regulator [Tepidibacter hydrothermalis]|uniref:MarR family transcriptional regulator n=1 Tax=Tepidibacter hydrothermalis TaxID=3036126 RepID=A0ABY8ECN8_9FIRM|nr:MarR family transcriptional regulator [Tepidibacter hydrothermalis]WFD09670.1 MarR family transcriptional regulator [Tepidibacter hydrothermalis]
MNNVKISYGEIDDLNLSLIISLFRCNQSFSKKNLKSIKEGGLTVSQFGVLEALYHKGDLRICEIIEKMLSTGGNMTVVIDNLEKSGFIKRLSDPNDRRATLISITEKGKDLIDDIFPKHLKEMREMLNELTKEEKKILIMLLKKMSGV